MRFNLLTTIFALITASLANWDAKLCSGTGGCLGTSWFPGTDFVCPNDLSLTSQQVAQNSVDMSSGLYDYVSADAFPKTCLRDVVAGPDTKLIVSRSTCTRRDKVRNTANVHQSHKAANGLVLYAFIIETCRDGPPLTPDCYNANPNPSRSVISLSPLPQILCIS